MLQFYLAMLDTEDEQSEFERLYITYRKLMYNIAMSRLHNPTDAEDAVEEAFLRVANKSANIFKVIGEDNKKYFLQTLIRNVAIDVFNKKTRHREIEYEDVIDSEPDDSVALEDIVIGKISQEEIIQYIKTMPDGMREALEAKYYHEMSSRVASEFLGISENAYRQRLFAARKMLKKYVDLQNDSISEQEAGLR